MMLFVSERNQNISKSHLEERRRHIGFSDLLTYLMMLDDSTVLHKDGALSKHFRYRAPDLGSSTDIELDAQAATWRHALAFLGDGWMVETQVLSLPLEIPAIESTSSELSAQLFEQERYQQFSSGEHFTTELFLSLTWKPEKVTPSWLRRFVLNASVKKCDFSQEMEQFQQQVAEFIGYLSSTINISPLIGDELTTLLYRSITGASQRLASPTIGCFLDSYLSGSDFQGGFSPQIGKMHIQILAIDDLPSSSYPCILDMLTYFPVTYRWSSRFICLDPLTAREYLKRYERSWSSKAIGVLGVIRESMGMPVKLDQDAEGMADTLRGAQTENSSGVSRFGFYSSNLVLMHEDKARLDELSNEITKLIQQLNFRVRQESLNATEAYLGSFPGHGDYNFRKLMVDTHYLSHALPLSLVYQGEPVCPCPYYGDAPALILTATQGSRPFMLNLHQGDVGHTAILGPTGSGKSTLLAALIMSHRKYKDSRVVVLDKDHSNRIPIKALNGQYYDLAQVECQLSPLSAVTVESLRSKDLAVEWLTDICVLQGVDMTPERQKSLREAVERLAHEDFQYKNLNHFAVQDPHLREAIRQFNTGLSQELLNGTENAFTKANVLGFEMSSLVNSENKTRDLSLPIIKAIFNQLESMFSDRRPTLMILEEAWLYLRHPLFREKLTDWFKTLRKSNVAVVFVSQDLSDIVECGAASIIQNSCMTRIYLPNKMAAEAQVRAHYQAFGLNDCQIEILRQATPKQDYYYHSPSGDRLFQLELGNVARAFCCVSRKEDIEAFNKIYQANTDDWIFEWLKHLGAKP